MVRVEICERGQGVTIEVTALKADVSKLRKDVDHLKSVDFTSLFESAEVLGADVSTYSEMLPSTTKDDIMEDTGVAKSKAETDKDQLEERDVAVYVDLADLEGAMF
ncbi:hypothetical protein H5410_027015 [Solanum commersonii]|uniref:Uncharacterized protein n=1 Tax=Solanum commersonii TaxID=4109 RepID=A0A9J5YXU3_SOLCO|nr:hypothetical protein H5410_027015 [Solanum commersonii]